MTDPFVPDPKMVARQIERAGKGKILDIGPGPNLFPAATHSVDWKPWPGCQVAPNHWIMNVTDDDLPYTLDSFDFIYCRHVAEDLRNPEKIFQFINDRTSRGYIETPSVRAELMPGIDQGNPWRGFYHHYWFCWVEGDTLHLLTKCVAVNYVAAVSRSDFAWNCFYEFEDGIKYEIHELGRDCELADGSYWQLLERALRAG